MSERITYYEGQFDFETLTPNWPKLIDKSITLSRNQQVKDYYQTHQKPQVYSWGLGFDKKYKIINKGNLNVGEMKHDEMTFFYGIRIEDFINFLLQQERSWKIYAHNLKGWDGRFLIPALTRMGFKPIPARTDKPDPERQMMLNNYYGKKTDYNRPLPFEWCYSIEKNKKIYWIKIFYPNHDKKSKKVKLRSISFEDNLLMFNTSVKEMGEQIANHYIKQGMDKDEASKKFHKEEIDYYQDWMFKDLYELKKSQDYKGLPYLFKDVYILYKFRKLMNEVLTQYDFPIDEWKRTQGASAVHSWKEIFGSELMTLFDKVITSKTETKGGKKYKLFNGGWKPEIRLKEDLIERFLPTKWLLVENTFDRVYRAYSGGITLINEKYRGVMVKDVYVADEVSAYPTIMESDLPAPYGEPVKEADGTFHIYEVIILSPLFNEKGMPFLRKQSLIDDENEFDGMTSEYLRHLEVGDIFEMTTPEYEEFLIRYKPEPYEYIKEALYSFKTKPMSFFFKTYINHWFTIKEKGKKDHNDFLKLFGKTQMNSLYGKFGTKRKHESYVWNADKMIYEAVEEDSDFIMYLPMALAITSYARMKLVQAVGDNYDDFIYGDTDSIFIKDRLKTELQRNGRITFGKKLGMWEIENTHPYTFVGRRAKQYLGICQISGRNCKKCKERDEKPIKGAYAGINFKKDAENGEKYIDILEFDDFIYGKDIDNQLTPLLIDEFGMALFENVKQIKPIWDYEPMKEQNVYGKEAFIKRYLETKKKPL